MKRRVWILIVTLTWAATLSQGREIDFIEQFALAEDRSVPLKQLIPGTEDYYYYHCLHYLNEGRMDEVEALLQPWIKRHNRTARVREIEHRRALLQYETDPEATQEYLRDKLNLHFNHQRELLNKKPNLRTSLEPKYIGREYLTEKALRLHSKTLGGFENASFEWLIEMDLDPDRRRHLLRRLGRPDYANLPRLIIEDLKYKDNRGFGSLPIHNRLLLSQLEKCLELEPELRNQTKFINVYLPRLRPDNDVGWKHDAEERERYYDRLWEFVSELNPYHNSLKALVLYHRLKHDRDLGKYNKKRFMTYLRLPRSASYVNRKYLQGFESRSTWVNFGMNYQSQTLLTHIGNDESLVRDFLMRFFADGDSTKPYSPFLNDIYLKECFAETKIVNGQGDREQLASMLPPAKYQALKERIDLDFAPTNQVLFGLEEKVKLDVFVKNVEKLIVKVYEINTLNFYKEHGKEVDTDVNLDGLVANEETVYIYKEGPLLRVKRSFAFPELKKRGVHIIEFIGNGKSSRALIRKGRLRYLERMGVAGHVFTVLDEKNRKVDDAAIWIAGREYKPGEKGTINIPFSAKPSRQPLVLIRGDFASLDFFSHQTERYAFTAAIHIDREALLKRGTARALIRPALTVNGTPVTLKVLEKPVLTISSLDRDGVSTSREIGDVELYLDRETVQEFKVPDRLQSLTFHLKVKVHNVSLNKEQDFSVAETFQLNAIDRTEKTEGLHFSHIGGEYFLDLLGKTGEVLPDRAVHIGLKHRDFRETVQVVRQTDAKGRVSLGKLEGILQITANDSTNQAYVFKLPTDRHNYPATIHGLAGETLQIPYMGLEKRVVRSEFSLIEKRNAEFFKDRFDALSLEDGFIKIQDLPPGDYDLLIKSAHPSIHIRLAGEQMDLEPVGAEGYVLAANRFLEVRNPRPLQITSVETDPGEIRVHLRNLSKYARIHAIATRYAPAYPVYESFSKTPFVEPYFRTLKKSESVYLSGRDIGDEYRYILDRKYSKKFVGNMLKRPSLLLNPWAVRKTETGRQDAEIGEEWSGEGAPRSEPATRAPSAPPPPVTNKDFANLDFLAEGAVVLANLVPDDDGVVTIDRKILGGRPQLHLVAVDPMNTVYREVSLSESASHPAKTDLRHIQGLDPELHFTEQKQISILEKGERFILPNVLTSKMEVYDTLGKVYRLYATLSKDPTLVEFGFILNWPEMKEEEKREKYSKYACHELSFFLYKKDPEFFNNVVLPYIANKKDKTFLDDWFVGEMEKGGGADELSKYLKPWSHERLNVMERILLPRSSRIEGEGSATARHVKDLNDLIPPDVERFNRLFKTALKSSSLDTGKGLGLEAAAKAELDYMVVNGHSAKLGDINGDAFADLSTIAMDGKERFGSGIALGESIQVTDIPVAALRPRGAGSRSSRSSYSRPGALGPKSGGATSPREQNRRAGGQWMLFKGGGTVDFEVLGEDDYAARLGLRRFYQKLDKTEEFAENNYYKLPIEHQNADRVKVNSYWRDYAAHQARDGFFSENLAEASNNFTDMMFALAVLDLPFEAGEHKIEYDGPRMTLEAKSPLVVYHKEIKEAKESDRETPLLVSQNFFRRSDRYRYENNEKFDKYVTEEFLVHVVYGCQIVITNPTSTRRKLDLLIEVPRGAVPVLNSHYTQGVHVDLQPYNTRTLEYHFYFPASGEFAHYPVHVARNENLVAHAEPFTFNVVVKPTIIDKTSWDYISQHGVPGEAVRFLEENNVNRHNLDRIAWRMRDKAYFLKILKLLDKRHVYNNTLWSYAIKHDYPAGLRQYLQHRGDFLAQCGTYLNSKIVVIDPVLRHSYQHLEYDPLVNARSHRLGKKREILNDRFYEQYHRLMKVLGYRAELDDDDLMAVAYYLLLQERVEEALAFFNRVDSANLETTLQYDYFDAYLSFSTGDLDKARAILKRHADHPVDRWRKRFAAAQSQLDEIEGAAAKAEPVDKKDRSETQTRLASTEPSLDFTVEARRISLKYQNLSEARVNYYLMDIELLFSRNPFVQEFSGQFSSIRPNASETLELDRDGSLHAFGLPERFHNSNVMVEISAGGVKKSQAYYANSLNVQVVENYGQVRVTNEKSGRNLAKVYVKVYARLKDGQIRFYKDGYTDLRGRFDYASLNTNEIEFVDKFSLLILSETDGAVVREASPPKR